mmetsp:Transcript_11588/g.20946  ORF Transcript_11588/g.20946 Transcript_11588/m.20946 type:complete len:1515 (-) Transcript_11588:179-4723(-)
MAARTGYGFKPEDPSSRFQQKRAQWDATKSFLEAQEKELLAETNRIRIEQMRQADKEKTAARLDWEDYGRKQHRQNMRTKKERESKDDRWKQKLMDDADNHRTLTNTKAKMKQESEIDQFEARLSRMGLDAKSKRAQDTGDDGKEAVLKLKKMIADQDEVPFKHIEKLATQTTKALAETKADSEQYKRRIQQRKIEDGEARKEREKRRRKMLLDQQKNYRDIDEKRRQEIMLAKLLRVSKQERQIAQDLCQQAEWKEVIVRNRAEREEQYAIRRQRDYEEEIERTAEVARREHEEYMRDTEAERQKWKQMWDQKQKKKRNKHYAWCQEILYEVLHVAENVVGYCERTKEDGRTYPRSTLVPKPLWKQWMTMFRNGQPLAPEPEQIIPPLPAEGEEEEDAAVDEDAAEVTHLLNDAELQDYLQLKDEWTDPSVPHWEDQYNTHLRDVMYRLQKICSPDPPPCSPALTPKIKVLLLGKPLSGKSLAAKECAKDYGLVYISPTGLIEEATKEFDPEADKASESLSAEMKNLYTEFLTLGRELRKKLHDGLDVDELALIPLLMNRLQFLEADPDVKGFLLDGIPSTEAGMRTIEKQLSGYEDGRYEPVKAKMLLPHLPPKPQDGPAPAPAPAPAGEEADEGRPDEAEDQAGEDALPTPPEPEPAYDISGFDLVVLVDVPNSTVFSRFSGQRQDPSNGMLYHMEYAPPPLDRVSSLVQLDRPTVSDQAMLQQKLMMFNHEAKRITKWLSKYGILTEVDGTKGMSDVQNDIVALIKHALAAKEQYVTVAKARQEKRERYEAALAERNADKPAEAAQEPPAVGEDGEPILLLDDAVVEAKEKLLDAQFAALFISQWDNLELVFSRGVAHVFMTLRHLRKRATEHFVVLQEQFHQFLVRPDNKQPEVANFQVEFNKIDYNLRCDADTKQELHLRTDQLQDILWTANDQRRDACRAEVKAYQEDEWLDIQRKAVKRQFVQLMQLEVDRFLQSRMFTMDYYFAVCGIDNTEDNVPFEVDITHRPEVVDTGKKGAKGGKKDDKKDAKAKPGAKGKSAAPGDDQDEEDGEDLLLIAYENAVNAVASPVEHHEEEDHKDKGAKAKTKKPGKGEEDEKPSQPQPAKIKDVVDLEQSLCLQRLQRLKDKCVEFIAETEDKADQVYEKMGEWLTQRYHEEMRSTAALLKIVRENIEEENPLPHELRLEGTDFIIDEDMLLFEPEEPVEKRMKAAMAAAGASGDSGVLVVTWLTKHQSLQLTAKFRHISPSGCLSKDSFTRLMLQIAATTHGKEHMPPAWAQLSRRHFDFAFDGFDALQRGTLDWREFMVSVLLWSNPRLPGVENEGTNPFEFGCPSMSELLVLRDAFRRLVPWNPNSYSELTITEEQLQAVPFWFDQAAGATKSQQLKAILWEVFRSRDTLHYPTLLLFLSIDQQTIRGVQKAFAMLSGDDSRLGRELLFELFHFHATSASDGDDTDDFSRGTIESVFEELALGQTMPEQVSFAQLCSTHMGRVMLNNAKMFVKKQINFC